MLFNINWFLSRVLDWDAKENFEMCSKAVMPFELFSVEGLLFVELFSIKNLLYDTYHITIMSTHVRHSVGHWKQIVLWWILVPCFWELIYFFHMGSWVMTLCDNSYRSLWKVGNGWSKVHISARKWDVLANLGCSF